MFPDCEKMIDCSGEKRQRDAFASSSVGSFIFGMKVAFLFLNNPIELYRFFNFTYSSCFCMVVVTKHYSLITRTVKELC